MRKCTAAGGADLSWNPYADFTVANDQIVN